MTPVLLGLRAVDLDIAGVAAGDAAGNRSGVGQQQHALVDPRDTAIGVCIAQFQRARIVLQQAAGRISADDSAEAGVNDGRAVSRNNGAICAGQIDRVLKVQRAVRAIARENKMTVWSARSSGQKRSAAPRQHRTAVEDDASIAAVSGKAGIGLIAARANVGELDLAGRRSQSASKVRIRIAGSRVGAYAQGATAADLQISAAERILVVESEHAALHDRVARVGIGCRQAEHAVVDLRNSTARPAANGAANLAVDGCAAVVGPDIAITRP